MARVINQFQKQFESLLAYWPNEGQELHQLRSKAFDQFKNLGFPTKQWEDWQFTDFSSFKKIDYRLSWAEDLPQLSNDITERISNTYLIFIVNGHYQPDLTNIPESISVTTNLDHFKANKELYLDHNNSNPFSALNTSMMNSGICITLDADVILDKPIQVIYATMDIVDPIMNHPRFIFQLGDNSEATIVEHYIGSTDLDYFINPVSNIFINNNAKLNHKVNVKMLDYRDVNKKYDSIISIEMIEAVGEKYLNHYFVKPGKKIVIFTNEKANFYFNNYILFLLKLYSI